MNCLFAILNASIKNRFIRPFEGLQLWYNAIRYDSIRFDWIERTNTTIVKWFCQYGTQNMWLWPAIWMRHFARIRKLTAIWMINLFNYSLRTFERYGLSIDFRVCCSLWLMQLFCEQNKCLCVWLQKLCFARIEKSLQKFTIFFTESVSSGQQSYDSKRAECLAMCTFWRRKELKPNKQNVSILVSFSTLRKNQHWVDASFIRVKSMCEYSHVFRVDFAGHQYRNWWIFR